MSVTNTAAAAVAPSFFSRIVTHDATRKGVAGAAAGLLIAVISEAIWPSA